MARLYDGWDRRARSSIRGARQGSTSRAMAGLPELGDAATYTDSARSEDVVDIAMRNDEGGVQALRCWKSVQHQSQHWHSIDPCHQSRKTSKVGSRRSLRTKLARWSRPCRNICRTIPASVTDIQRRSRHKRASLGHLVRQTFGVHADVAETVDRRGIIFRRPSRPPREDQKMSAYSKHLRRHKRYRRATHRHVSPLS